MAEKKGFEPLLGLHPLSVFETDPFSRLGTSPSAKNDIAVLRSSQAREHKDAV